MNLIFKNTGEEVKVGNRVELDGEIMIVSSFRPPHKPSSSGKVCLKYAETGEFYRELFVPIIGAEWVNREDRV